MGSRVGSRAVDAVALTFDDGPHPEGTPAVLDELERRGARATFFFVGEQVRPCAGGARAAADAGHEIALHGDRHTLLLRRRTASVAADLDRAAETIAEATGGSGALSAAVRRLQLRRAPARARTRPRAVAVVVLGARLGAPCDAGIDRAARHAGLEPGAVVLLHDSDAYSSAGSWRRTAAAVPSILDAAAALGVSVESVTQST